MLVKRYFIYYGEALLEGPITKEQVQGVLDWLYDKWKAYYKPGSLEVREEMIKAYPKRKPRQKEGLHFDAVDID